MKFFILLFLFTTASLFSQDKLIWENQGNPTYNSNALISGDESTLAIANSSQKPFTIWNVADGTIKDNIETPISINYDINLTGEYFAYVDNQNLLHLRSTTSHSDYLEFQFATEKNIRAIKLLNKSKIPLVALLVIQNEKYSVEVLDMVKQEITQQYQLEKDIYDNIFDKLYTSELGRFISLKYYSGKNNGDKDTITQKITLIDTDKETIQTKQVTVNPINDIKILNAENKILIATGSWYNDFENLVVLDLDLNKIGGLSGKKANIYMLDYKNSSSDILALSDDSLYTLNPNLEVVKSQKFAAYHTLDFLSQNRYLQLMDYQVRIRDIDSKAITKTFELYQGDLHRMTITDIAVSKDDQYVFSSSYDGSIKKWDAKNGQFIENFISSDKSIRNIEISNDNKYMAYTSQDDYENILTVVDMQSKAVKYKLNMNYTILDIKISSDSKYIIAGTYQGQVYKYNFENGVIKDSLEAGDWINTVGISSNNKYIASGNNSGVFKLWDAENNHLIFDQKITDKNGLYSIEFSSNGNDILIGSGDGTMKVFNINDLIVKKQYYSYENSSSWSIFKDAIYAKDGNSIYGGMSQGIKTFKLGNSSGDLIKPANTTFISFTIECLDYSNNESSFYSGDSRGTVSKWKGDAFTNVETIDGVTDFVVYPNPVQNTLHINLDNRFIYTNYKITNLSGQEIKSGSFDSDIRVEDLTTGTYIITLLNNKSSISNKFVKQ